MEKRVLLIDSDPVFTDQVSRSFQAAQVAVTIVSDDGQAITKAKSARPDLIVLADLPDRNIFAVCNRVKRTAGLAEVPMVLLCAETTEQAIEAHRTSRTPAEGYLQKPIGPDDLLASLRRWLGDVALPQGTILPDDDEAALPGIDDDEVIIPTVTVTPLPGPGAAPSPAPPPAAGPPPPMPKAAPPPMPKAAPPPMPKFSSGGTGAARLAPGGPAAGAAYKPTPDPFADAGPEPRPPMAGSPEEKLKFFRDRVKAKDDLIQRARTLWAEREEHLRSMQIMLAGLTHELASEKEARINEANGLAAELDQKSGRLLELERVSAQQAQELAALSARAGGAEEKLADADARAKSLSEVLNDSLRERELSDKAWSARVAEAEKVAGEAQAELEGLRAAKAQLDQALEAAVLEVRELKTQLAGEQARAAGLAQDLEDGRKDLEAQTTKLREELEGELHAVKLEAESRRRSLEQELDATRGRLEDELAEVRGELSAKVAELEGELAATREEAGQRSLELEDARAKLDDLASRLRDAEARSEGQGQEASALREQLAARDREAAALRGELEKAHERAVAVAKDQEAAREKLIAEGRQRIAEAEQRAQAAAGQATEAGQVAKREVEAARAAVAEREVALADRKREADGLRAELDQVLARIAERDHQLEQAKKAAADLKAKAEKAQKELAARTAEAESLRATAQTAGGSAATLKEQLAQKEAALAEAKTALGQRDAALAEVRATLQQREKEGVAAQGVATELSQARAALSKAEAEKKQLEAQLQKAKAAPAAGGGDAALRSQIGELEKQLAGLRDQAATYKGDRDKAAAAYERAREEAARHRRALERLGGGGAPGGGGADPAELERLKAEVVAANADRERMQDELAAQIATIAGDLAAKDSELQSGKRKLAQLEQAAQKLKAERDRLKAAEGQLAQATMTLQQLRADQERTRTEHRTQLEQLEKRFADQLTKVAGGGDTEVALALRQRIVELQNEKKALEAKNSELAAAAAGASGGSKAEVERLAGEVEDLTSENEFLQTEVDRYAKQVQELVREKAAADGIDADRTVEITLRK